jgi:hypothetical protein
MNESVTKSFSVILTFVLSGCAIYSHETMVSTYVSEGGLDYYQIERKTDTTYLYDVRVFEMTRSADALHSYETNTPELRIKTAEYLLSSKYHTGCEKVEFLSESSYQDYQQNKVWLRGRWWSVKVLCRNPIRPRKNKYN